MKDLITNQLLLSLQNLHKILPHINVDRAVTGKCAASFDVAGEGCNEVRVFDQFVDIADEGTTSHMTAGNFVDRNFLFCACQGIQFNHQICYPCFFKNKFDIVIVSL